MNDLSTQGRVQSDRAVRRALTSAVVLLALFCLLTSLTLAGGAYLFLRPGGLFDQSGWEEDLPDLNRQPGIQTVNFLVGHGDQSRPRIAIAPGPEQGFPLLATR